MWYNVSELFQILNCKLFVNRTKGNRMKHRRISLTDVDGYVRDKFFDLTDSYDTPSRSLDLHRVMFEQTTAKQKRYLLMYYKDNMTMDEIADRCGVAKSTVSRTIARGRDRIIKGLRDSDLRRLLEKL